MKEKTHLRAQDKIKSDSLATRISAWKKYQELIKTMPDDQAIKEALKKATPSKSDPYYSQFNPNKPREFKVWDKHGLWPPPELKEQEKEALQLTVSDTVRMTQEEVQEALESGRKSRQEKQLPIHDNIHRITVLSDEELLRKVKAMLDKIEIAERPTTARGRESTLKTGMIAARFPKTLIEELEALPGRKSHHLEKALTLYLRAIKSEE